jgi:TetR/AcrR family transcriptional regulator, transcriptional repressor for nem operon
VGAEKAASGGPSVTYESLVDEYLSEAHRDHPATGCPVGALAGDIARTDKRTRTLVTQEVQRSIDSLANSIRAMGEEDDGEAKSRAIMAYCTLIGAISVARAVSDQKLSREILKTVPHGQRAPEQTAVSSM